MPFYVGEDDWNQYQSDQWGQQAQSNIADQWANQTQANVPSVVADATDRLNQQQQQDALTKQQTDLTAQTQQAAQAGYAAAAQEKQQQDAADQWAAQSYGQAATQASGVAPQPIPQPSSTEAPDPTSPTAAAGNYVAYAWQAAQKAGLDPSVFVRQLQQESGFQPFNADGKPKTSPAGAVGIAQFMPGTAQGLGIDPTDPLASIDAAAKLMASYNQKYNGDQAKALAAYNAGPGNVDKFGGVPPFAETQSYVKTILGDAGGKAAQLAQQAQQGASQLLQAPVQSADSIMQKVQPFLGNAYVWGGKSPQQGFDCSGLAGYLTTGQPESTTTLYGKSTTVTPDQAQPGDLVFWNMNSNDPHMQHVAVYTGNGQIVQSGGNQSAVNVGSVNQQIGSAPEFRRVAGSAGQGAPAQAQAPAGAPPPSAPPTQQFSSMADFINQYQQQNGAMPSDQELGQFVQSQQQQPSIMDTLQGAGSAIGGAIGGIGNAASGALQAAQPALNTAGDLASGGITRAFNQQLQSLGQNVLAPPINAAFDALNPSSGTQPPLAQAAGALSQQNVPFLSGAAGVAQPILAQGGALDALVNPALQGTPQQALAIGGLTAPVALEKTGMQALAPEVSEAGNAVTRLLGLPQRTPIGEGGLGTPNYAFPEGSPEQQITQVLRNSAAADESGRARLTSEQMSQLPGMPNPDAPRVQSGKNAGAPGPYTGTPPALDDWRSAIDAGIQHAQWYTQFAKGIVNTIGRANIPEFAGLFGITSPQAKVDVNLSQTLALMRMAREFEANGTPFTEETIQNWVHQTDPSGVQINGILKNDGTPGGWQSWTGQKARQVAQLYSEGSVEVPSNAKTPSYAGNILSALENHFDPNSTIDTWMFQLAGYPTAGGAASEDLAYRAMRTLNGHLAGEIGITPNQAQAAAWFGMKAVKDFADTAGAPKVLKDAIADYGTPGSTTTLGDLVAMGKNEGGRFGDYGNLFDSPAGTWEDTINTPKIAHQLGMLPDNVTETVPPGSGSAARLTYPGKTTKAIPSSYPVTPADTAARRAEAEGMAPTVGVPKDALDALGYNPETNQFAAFGAVPHIVDHQPNATNVLIPGGNVDALQYVGAVSNKAAGADAMDIHMFTPHGAETAGYHVLNSDGSLLEGAQSQAVRDALDKHDLSYSTSPDGTIVRVHVPTEGDRADFEARMQAALGNMSNVQVDELKGVAQRVGSDQYDEIIQRYGPRYSSGGQSSLQAGQLGIGGQEAAQGQIGQGAAQDAGAAQAQPPAITGGAQAGAINPQFASSLGGAAAGGLAGYNSDPNAPEEVKIQRAAAGALAGAGLGYAAATVATSGVNAWDVIQAERIGSMAGGIPTIAHIAFNAPLQTAWKLFADAPLSIKNPETMPLEFVGAWKGLTTWAPTAFQTLTAPGKLAQQAGGGVAGQALETGLLGLVRTHPVMQDMARQIGQSMETWRLAGEEAAKTQTRFSGQWWNEVNKLVAAPTSQMVTEAGRVGDQFALRGPMGTMGTKLGDFLQDNPLGRFLNPFFNIGYHVGAQGVERSPLGIAGTAFDVGRAALGHGPYAGIPAKVLPPAPPPGSAQRLQWLTGQGPWKPQPGTGRFNFEGTDAVTALGPRIRNNLLGLGAATWAYSQAAQGNITGSGPSDPKILQEMQGMGWQPDSIRIQGRYYPLHTLGALGWPLGMAANLYESTHTGDEGGYMKPDAKAGEQLGDFGARMGEYFQNETFLRGIGDLTKAMGNARNAQNDIAYQASSTLGSLIPQGALLSNIASSADPFQRKTQAGDVGQALENRLPGLRENLPVKLSPTGLPMENPQAGTGILGPRSSLQQSDPVAQMLLGVGMSPPSAPTEIKAGNRSIELTADEKYHYQELRGQLLQQVMSPLAQNPQFQQVPPIQRKQQLEKVMQQVDSMAQRQLLGEIAQGGNIASRLGPTAAQKPPQSFVPMGFAPPTPLDQTAAPTRQQLPFTSDLATLSPQAQEQLAAR